jgi:hypothetical protein
MKLLVQSAMIFFGTLMAAGLVALGEPARGEHSAAPGARPASSLNHLVEAARPWVELTSAAQSR